MSTLSETGSETGGAPSARPEWARIERELVAAGFRASRRFGQNFLRDPHAVASVIAAAELTPGVRVLEVGPGYGVLSFELAAAGAELVAFEIDPRLAEVAERVLAPFPRARVVRGDALDGKHALAPQLLDVLREWPSWMLVANLPYSIASPLLAEVARLATPPSRIVATVQLEVAERLLAEPGGGDFGPLSVRVQLAYGGTLVRRVAPGAFSPRPDVASAIVRLDLRTERPALDDWEPLDRLVDTLFQQRRKAVLGVLRHAFGAARVPPEERGPAAERLLAAHGVAGDLRPERLAPKTLLALSRDPAWRELLARRS
ncbi:MAG: 16S rRNA (adenine(1518)-N(6)/adenine(1519)-N(6))-dimethyltransferase RsmA [Planctomycetes bacterium]|nr:16S rRNA (adenine(1518)-N(6)/adenine(1519)-N(6))-dimethyltransferase RsmA [Planctomycetota bacterium]